MSPAPSFFQQVSGHIQFCHSFNRVNQPSTTAIIKALMNRQPTSEWKSNLRDPLPPEQNQDQVSQPVQKLKQIFVSYDISPQSQTLKIVFQYLYPIDQADGLGIASISARFPPTEVFITKSNPSNSEQNQAEEGPLYTQIFLCEQMKGDRYFYNMIYNSLQGETRYPVHSADSIKFKNIKFLKSSTNSKVFRLFIGLFREKDKTKIYKDLHISQPLFIAQSNKVIFIDDKSSLNLFFSKHLEIDVIAPSRIGRIFTRTDEQLKIEDQLKILESHLSKSSNKIANIFYLAHKFQNCCELYLKTQNKPPIQLSNEPKEQGTEKDQEKEQFLKLKKEYIKEIVDMIKTIIKQIASYKQISQDSSLCCNRVNPESKIVLRIIRPLQKSRIVMAEEYTKFFSVIIGDNQCLKDYERVDSNQIKDIYYGYNQSLPSKKRRRFPRKHSFIDESSDGNSLSQSSLAEQKHQAHHLGEVTSPIRQVRSSCSQQMSSEPKNKQTNFSKKRGRKTNAQRQARSQASQGKNEPVLKRSRQVSPLKNQLSKRDLLAEKKASKAMKVQEELKQLSKKLSKQSFPPKIQHFDTKPESSQHVKPQQPKSKPTEQKDTFTTPKTVHSYPQHSGQDRTHSHSSRPQINSYLQPYTPNRYPPYYEERPIYDQHHYQDHHEARERSPKPNSDLHSSQIYRKEMQPMQRNFPPYNPPKYYHHYECQCPNCMYQYEHQRHSKDYMYQSRKPQPRDHRYERTYPYEQSGYPPRHPQDEYYQERPPVHMMRQSEEYYDLHREQHPYMRQSNKEQENVERPYDERKRQEKPQRQEKLERYGYRPQKQQRQPPNSEYGQMIEGDRSVRSIRSHPFMKSKMSQPFSNEREGDRSNIDERRFDDRRRR